MSDPSAPPNAFTPDFLARRREETETETVWQALWTGSWSLHPHPCGWAVLRSWEDPARRHRPAAVLLSRRRSELLAAVLPALAQEVTYEVGSEREELGFPLRRSAADGAGETVGWLAYRSPEISLALHLVEGLLLFPPSVAALLREAGSEFVEQVGQILAAETSGTG